MLKERIDASRQAACKHDNRNRDPGATDLESVIEICGSQSVYAEELQMQPSSRGAVPVGIRFHCGNDLYRSAGEIADRRQILRYGIQRNFTPNGTRQPIHASSQQVTKQQSAAAWSEARSPEPDDSLPVWQRRYWARMSVDSGRTAETASTESES